jgi:hypothetical protein
LLSGTKKLDMMISSVATSSDLASPFRERGASYVNELISDGAEETLYLEFKTLAESSGEKLTKEDRKVLARAICGMANADGGVIVVGVETRRVDNVDVAIGKKLISDPEKLRNRLTAAVPEMLSPQHPQINVFAIHESSGTSGGFLAIEVMRSEARPHYSNVHHQYFRRGSDGTRVLEHSEIRELILAVRESTLDISCDLRGSSYTGDLRFNLSLVLTLRNVGRVPAVAPYIRIMKSGWRPTNIDHLGIRFSASGSYGIYGTRDVLVHVDDDITMAEIPTGLDFRRTGQFQVEAAVRVVRQNGPHSFLMAPLSDMPQQGFTTHDRTISVSGFYGAENVASKEFGFEIGKMELFDLFCRSRNL